MGGSSCEHVCTPAASVQIFEPHPGICPSAEAVIHGEKGSRTVISMEYREHGEAATMKRMSFSVTGLLVMFVFLSFPVIAEEKVQIVSQTEWGDKLLLPGFLYTPSGDGPFPAVIMLCGCGGIGRKSRWSEYAPMGVEAGGVGICCTDAGQLHPSGFEQHLRISQFRTRHDGVPGRVFREIVFVEAPLCRSEEHRRHWLVDRRRGRDAHRLEIVEGH